MRVRPAPPGAGVVFVRTDLPGAPRVPANADHLGVRQRRTALVGPGDAEVHTVEHFLACCTGLGVDNLIVELDGPECPGMDGSGAAFADLLQQLDPLDQAAERPEILVEAPVAVAAGAAALIAIPQEGGFRAWGRRLTARGLGKGAVVCLRGSWQPKHPCISPGMRWVKLRIRCTARPCLSKARK